MMLERKKKKQKSTKQKKNKMLDICVEAPLKVSLGTEHCRCLAILRKFSVDVNFEHLEREKCQADESNHSSAVGNHNPASGAVAVGSGACGP
jgi:hypothetical protein